MENFWWTEFRNGSGFCVVWTAYISYDIKHYEVATFAEAVFVLHSFQKKTQRTSMRDIELATTRFKELARSMRK